jgi:branched-chain amino acid transport system ATP-binding protein
MDISDEITVLNFGGIIAQGNPSEIQANPEVIAVYLGDEE